MEVKRLNYFLYWVKPSTEAEFQQIMLARMDFSNSPVRRMDQWIEVLGLAMQPCWLRLMGTPLHTWSKRVFCCLGKCFGIVLQIDEDAILRRRVDVVFI